MVAPPAWQRLAVWSWVGWVRSLQWGRAQMVTSQELGLGRAEVEDPQSRIVSEPGMPPAEYTAGGGHKWVALALGDPRILGSLFPDTCGAVMGQKRKMAGQGFIHRPKGATAPRVDEQGRVCWARGLHGVSCVHMGLVEGGGQPQTPSLSKWVTLESGQKHSPSPGARDASWPPPQCFSAVKWACPPPDAVKIECMGRGWVLQCCSLNWRTRELCHAVQWEWHLLLSPFHSERRSRRDTEGVENIWNGVDSGPGRQGCLAIHKGQVAQGAD